MSIARRLVLLRGQVPFDRLSDAEATALAAVAVEQSREAGKVVSPANEPLKYLYIVVRGQVLHGEQPLPAVFGGVAMATGATADVPLLAGPDGVDLLLIARPHFFTLVAECPWLLMELAQRGTS